MGEIMFGIWNVEWMNDLFTGDDPPFFKADDLPVRGPRHDNTVRQRRTHISGVINDINIDALVIVEGPNRVEELQLFFDSADVNGDWRCAVQPSGAQSVGAAFRVDTGKFADPPFTQFDSRLADEAPLLKPATDPFERDTDRDGLLEIHKFERRPLYVEANLADGSLFRILGVHLKSKGIFDSLEWSAWWARAEGNRKKLLAQCQRLRQAFLDQFLMAGDTAQIPLIVCGDINDGPGFDTSEMQLQASGVETLMGSVWKPQLALGNALFDTLDVDEQQQLDFSGLQTASFRDPIFESTYQRVWIDHILYSKNAADWVSEGTIRIDMSDGQRIYSKFPTASDHFPVTCSVTIA